jgi:hypothetical protein
MGLAWEKMFHGTFSPFAANIREKSIHRDKCPGQPDGYWGFERKAHGVHTIKKKKNLSSKKIHQSAV